MVLLKNELRRGRKSLLIWSISITAMLVLCIFMYPEMKNSTADISNLFASMGDFTAAFGLNKLNFGTLIGYYGIECGNVLAIGGALYSAYIGATALSGEDTAHTADFLLTHPLKRGKIFGIKLLAVGLNVIILNIICAVCAVLSVYAIGEKPEWGAMLLYHAALLIAQLEIGTVTYGISVFIRHGASGIGMAVACVAYFANIIANITEKASFIGYLTPFSYSDAADIIPNNTLEWPLVITGVIAGCVIAGAGYLYYRKKDIL